MPVDPRHFLTTVRRRQEFVLPLRGVDQNHISRRKTHDRLADTHHALTLNAKDIQTACGLRRRCDPAVWRPDRRVRVIRHRLTIQQTRGSAINFVQGHLPFLVLNHYEAATHSSKTTRLPPPHHGGFNLDTVDPTLGRLYGRGCDAPRTRDWLHLTTRNHH